MDTRSITSCGLGLGMALLLLPVRYAPAQTTAVPAATQPATTTAAPARAKKASRKRQTSTTGQQLKRIPIEQAPPSSPGPDETSAQRAADQKLLLQQQTQSAQAAQVTDQQVRTAQQRIDKVQGEQRIQDAPGPSQTGIVPAAGPPLVPASGGSSTSGGSAIQDAPGPAQTLAPPPQPTGSVPAQPLQPAQPPQL